jgi:hypothetical protein
MIARWPPHTPDATRRRPPPIDSTLASPGIAAGGAVHVPTTLIDCQVWRTAFDYQVRLTLIGRDPDEGYRVDAELVIETPFLLRDAAGEWHELDPGTGSNLAPVLDLFMNTIKTIEVRDRGALSITFDDGAELFVAPHTQFESWQLAGLGVEPIQVGPGGHTDWQPAPSAQ